MRIVAYVLTFLTLILNGSLFVKLKPPYSFYFVAPQVIAAALSPFLVILGGAGAVLGWLSHAPVAFAAGVLGAAVSIVYMVLVTIPQPSFAEAFGKDWESRIPPAQKARMIKRRWQIGLPKTQEPRLEQDIAFWTPVHSKAPSTTTFECCGARRSSSGPPSRARPSRS
jgi:hypothetical protein